MPAKRGIPGMAQGRAAPIGRPAAVLPSGDLRHGLRKKCRRDIHPGGIRVVVLMVPFRDLRLLEPTLAARFPIRPAATSSYWQARTRDRTPSTDLSSA